MVVLDAVRLRGLSFKLFDPRGLYPNDDRMSFVFVECPEHHFLDGRLVEVAERDGKVYLSTPSIHLRSYLEDWTDCLFAWIRFFLMGDFWWQRRIGHLVDRLLASGDPGGLEQRAAAVRERLPAMFDGRVPRASLLHGDLWGGNAAFDVQGRPVVYDPACYHGDRETDIAMTELFGGFDPRFHAAYREAWPLAVGYAWRRSLYGAGWWPRVRDCLDRVIAETA